MRALALLLVPVLGLAQSVAVSSGPVDDQVLQRDGQDRTVVELKGRADGADGKAVEARVTAKRDGFGWKSIGRVESGSWTGSFTLPAGGPYKIELRAAGGSRYAVIQNILVGDLWVLAGQSNMEGVGNLENVQPPNDLVHSFDQADRWGVAIEPLHRLPDAADRVHWRTNPQTKQPERLEGDALKEFIANRKKGAGLGLPFAVNMLERTRIPIGLVPCAHGGTSMDQWDPVLKDKAGDSLYGATLRRVRIAGGKIKGILWYQGESDANPKSAPEFLAKFERLVAAFRDDLGQPDLPFYYVQIGRHINNSNVGEWNSVQESQRLAEDRIPHSGMATPNDLSLDDGIHVSTPDLKRLGVRMANLACHDLFPSVASCTSLKRGPRPVSARFAEGIVKVSFNSVNGTLESAGRVSGFTIHDASGQPVPAIYKQIVGPQDPFTILLYISGKLPEGATLRYGYGKDPYCNVVDAADMALPAFGPMPIQ